MADGAQFSQYKTTTSFAVDFDALGREVGDLVVIAACGSSTDTSPAAKTFGLTGSGWTDMLGGQIDVASPPPADGFSRHGRAWCKNLEAGDISTPIAVNVGTGIANLDHGWTLAIIMHGPETSGEPGLYSITDIAYKSGNSIETLDGTYGNLVEAPTLDPGAATLAYSLSLAGVGAGNRGLLAYAADPLLNGWNAGGIHLNNGYNGSCFGIAGRGAPDLDEPLTWRTTPVTTDDLPYILLSFAFGFEPTVTTMAGQAIII